jgi:hypothetical protein
MALSQEDTYIEYLESMKTQFGSDSNDSLSEIIEFIKQKKEEKIKADRFKKQTENFNNKLQMLIIFVKFLQENSNSFDLCIYGSFIRQLIEKILVSTASNDNYANPINHDIDIAIYFDEDAYKLNKDKLEKIIEFLKMCMLLGKYDSAYHFGNYKIISIYYKNVSDTTNETDGERAESGFIKKIMKNIPHYNIILQNINDDKDILKIDLLAYKNVFNTIWGTEFNINSLQITKLGISQDGYDFFQTLHSILNRYAICDIDFNKQNTEIQKRFSTRREKETIFNQVLHYITHRTKILDIGYQNIFSNSGYFNIIVEKDNPCDITGNEPPYYKIELQCGHILSLMAIVGIINIRGSEYTEAINCPLCRNTLLFKIIEKFPPKIKYPTIEYKSSFIEIEEYDRTYEKISRDNINYICGIMNHMSLQEINDILAENLDTRPGTRTNILNRTRMIFTERYLN